MRKRGNLPRGMNQRTIQGKATARVHLSVQPAKSQERGGKVLLVGRRARRVGDLDQVKVILRTEGTTHFSHSDLWHIFPLLM